MTRKISFAVKQNDQPSVFFFTSKLWTYAKLKFFDIELIWHLTLGRTKNYTDYKLNYLKFNPKFNDLKYVDMP